MDALLTDRDVPALSADWARVDGAQEAAQNVVEALFIPIGSLPWDRAAGSYLPLWLNDIVTPAAVVAELRRVALSIPQVRPWSIVVDYDAEKEEYRIGFIGPDDEPATVLVPPAATPSSMPTPPVTPPSSTGSFGSGFGVGFG